MSSDNASPFDLNDELQERTTIPVVMKKNLFCCFVVELIFCVTKSCLLINLSDFNSNKRNEKLMQ